MAGAYWDSEAQVVDADLFTSVMLNSLSFAASNDRTSVDTFWTSQLIFPTEVQTDVQRKGGSYDKFFVPIDWTLEKEDPEKLAALLWQFGTMTVSEGNTERFVGNKDAGASMEVKDADGNVVYSMKVEAQNGNTAQGTLVCTDFNQNGPYTVSLAGNTSAFFYDEGVVEGISTIDGITKIKVNGLTIAVSEIFEISSTTVTS